MAHGMVIGRSGDLWTNLSAAARSRVRAKRYSVTVTRARAFIEHTFSTSRWILNGDRTRKATLMVSEQSPHNPALAFKQSAA